MNYKTPFYITFIILVACILIYWFYLKPDYTNLERAEPEQQEITFIENVLAGKDSLLARYKDSLKQSRNNVKVITRTVIKEQTGIISEPLTDSRILKTKTFLADFYDSKSREIGIDPQPEIKLPQIAMTTKEFKGTELLISDYKAGKEINGELYNQTELLSKSNEILQSQKKDLYRIIDLKEQQIIKLERTPVPIITARKWYIDVLIVTGALTAGFTAGVIYSNNR